mgnify:FL=1
MPRAGRYALIPDGYSLTKVTKAEEQAVKDLRRHENFKTFLNNETTPLLIGGAALATLTPILITLVLQLLEEQGAVISSAQKAGVKAALASGGLSGIVLSKVLESDLPDIGDILSKLKVIT